MLSDQGINPDVLIQAERPDSPDARELIAELEAYLIPLSPPESRHGYSIEQLLASGVSFFVLRKDGIAAGCGGVQFFRADPSASYAELKRIYMRPAYRGTGLAKQLILYLENYTRAHGIQLIRLETGTAQVEAHGLYERMGYWLCAPFGAYQPDPHSRFYEKRI